MACSALGALGALVGGDAGADNDGAAGDTSGTGTAADDAAIGAEVVVPEPHPARSSAPAAAMDTISVVTVLGTGMCRSPQSCPCPDRGGTVDFGPLPAHRASLVRHPMRACQRNGVLDPHFRTCRLHRSRHRRHLKVPLRQGQTHRRRPQPRQRQCDPAHEDTDRNGDEQEGPGCFTCVGTGEGAVEEDREPALSTATRSAIAAPIVIPFLCSFGRWSEGRLRSLLFCGLCSWSPYPALSTMGVFLPRPVHPVMTNRTRPT